MGSIRASVVTLAKRTSMTLVLSIRSVAHPSNRRNTLSLLCRRSETSSVVRSVLTVTITDRMNSAGLQQGAVVECTVVTLTQRTAVTLRLTYIVVCISR